MAAKKTEKKNPMTIINSHIKAGEFKRVYLLFGDETYLVQQYKDKLVNALTDVEDTLNFSKFVGEGSDPTEMISFCQTMPFFADRRVVLVSGSGLFAKSNDYLADNIPGLPDTAVMVFVEKDVDKRSRTYKAVDRYGETLEFVTPDERTLTIWITAQVKAVSKEIEQSAVFKLIENAGSDMNVIRNELDKLIAYCMDVPRITLKDVNEICISNPEDDVFQMIECIARGQKSKAIHLYHGLLDRKEPALKILFLIARQFDILLKIKLCAREGKTDEQTAEITGIRSWLVKKYREQSDRYSYEQLRTIVDKCQEMDYKFKTGQISDTIAVELLIVEISGGYKMSDM